MLNIDNKVAPHCTHRQWQLYLCGLLGLHAPIAALCKTLEEPGSSRKVAQYHSRKSDQLGRTRWSAREHAHTQGRHSCGVSGIQVPALVGVDEIV